jgi:hypothetical protein
MAKDCICEKLLFNKEDSIINRERATISLDQSKDESVTVSPHETPPTRELAQPASTGDIEAQKEAVAEEDDVFTLFQTSFFHDNLRIKIDMESQFAFMLGIAWIMHYLYLCIVVYVLREEEVAPWRRRNTNRTAFTMHGARSDYGLAHPTPAASANRPVADYWNPEENATHATDSTHDGRELFHEGGEPATGGTHSDPKTLEGAKASISSSQRLQEEHIASEEAAARTALGLPEFISIQQPSYLAALCMLESDTDDDSDSALS